MRIRCTTTVDITATGVKNRFYKSRMPFRDDLGRLIDTDAVWQAARTQQGNWETINQIISLRTLPENISKPVIINSRWQFDFDVIDPAAVNDGNNPVGLLIADCDGVPILNNAQNPVANVFKTQCDANIWFDIISTYVLNNE